MLFLIPTVTALVLVLYFLQSNLVRTRTKETPTLRPNCLLTEAPLLFISGSKSLLYFLNYWNGIPRYLSDHGYEVEQLQLPWRDEELRLKHTLENLSQRQRPVHIVADPNGLSLAKNLLNSQHPHIRSLSLVAPQGWSEALPKGIQLHTMKTHQRWSLTTFPWWIVLLVGRKLGFNKNLSPSLLAMPQLTQTDLTHSEYLNFAISLAESDMQ